MTNARWLRQTKDSKGKEKCEAQAKQMDEYVKYLKETKGKKGKGEGKAKGTEEPEVVKVDDDEGDEGRSSFQ